MPDDGHLPLEDLMSYARGHLNNGHDKELEYALSHATFIPLFLSHGRIDLAKRYLENARGYSKFTTDPVAELDGYLSVLEEEISIAERCR